jgi:hypothetical protein
VNNPAGIAQLDNGTLLMCMEASIAHGGGASQGTTIVASDSGSWRGPWRWVTPGRLPIGWPQGHEGNAEDPFFWRSKRGFHVLFHEFNNRLGSGGYSYSADAVSWTTVNNVAYNMSVVFASELPSPFNGTRVPQCPGPDNGEDSHHGCIGRRERPELVFAEPPNNTHRYSERPIYLLNGVQARCEGVVACEAIYGKCTKGSEEGHCSQTVSVTIATKLPSKHDDVTNDSNPKARLNVIFNLVDDRGYNDVGFHDAAIEDIIRTLN